MLFGASDGRMAIEYTEGAPFTVRKCTLNLSLAEISSKLLKDSVSNYRGRTFSDLAAICHGKILMLRLRLRPCLRAFQRMGINISLSRLPPGFLELGECP